MLRLCGRCSLPRASRPRLARCTEHAIRGVRVMHVVLATRGGSARRARGGTTERISAFVAETAFLVQLGYTGWVYVQSHVPGSDARARPVGFSPTTGQLPWATALAP